MARKGATVVSETASAYCQKKIREDTDDNAALDAAEQMELVGESLARKSIYVRERLKENRQRNNRLRESVLEEMEKSRLLCRFCGICVITISLSKTTGSRRTVSCTGSIHVKLRSRLNSFGRYSFSAFNTGLYYVTM